MDADDFWEDLLDACFTTYSPDEAIQVYLEYRAKTLHQITDSAYRGITLNPMQAFQEVVEQEDRPIAPVG